MSSRPALIFDFGNVVAHFDFTRSCAQFGRPIGLSGADFLAKAKASGFTELLKVYESGRMTSAAFHGEVCDRMGICVPFDEFARTWGDIFTGNESVHQVIADLKKRGHRLFLGSNTNDLHFRFFRRQFDTVLSQFDALVLSYEVGHIKPQAGFFHEAARIAGRPVHECVFIDDVEENIEGARAAGLIGLLYRDTPTLVHDLRGLGITLTEPIRIGA